MRGAVFTGYMLIGLHVLYHKYTGKLFNARKREKLDQ